MRQLLQDSKLGDIEDALAFRGPQAVRQFILRPAASCPPGNVAEGLDVGHKGRRLLCRTVVSRFNSLGVRGLRGAS